MPGVDSARRVSPFGELLRHWRAARKRSQLELAVEAGVSSRHLSFIETGRARPSREMVLRLARVLDVPLRERNALLDAAGFAPVYAETDLFAPELASVRRSIEFLLERHNPNPALLVDRLWNVRLVNRAAAAMMALLLSPEQLALPQNAVASVFRPSGLRPYIRNWEEVASALILRVQRELLGAACDPALRDLLDELLAAEGVPDDWGEPRLDTPLSFVLPIDVEKDGVRLSLFSAITTLGTARDITLSELRLETFFPLDTETERNLRELANER